MQQYEQIQQQINDMVSKVNSMNSNMAYGMMNPQQIQQMQQQQSQIPMGIHPLFAQYGMSNGFWNQNSDQFSMGGSMGGLLTVHAGANILAIILGVVFASVISGLFNRFLNLGSIGTLIAGIIIRWITKGKGFLADFGLGVMIAGGATLLSGLTGSLTGGGTAAASSMNGSLGGMTF